MSDDTPKLAVGDAAGRSLPATEARLREALEIMGDGFALYDPEGRLEFCNNSFRLINDYSEADTRLGIATYDGLGRLDEVQSTDSRKLMTFEQRLAQLRRDGASVVIQTYGNRIYERHQSATPSGGMISLLTDITNLKRTEEALRQALEQADQASRAKTEFLATMSHEIRTPIAGVLGLADIVLDDDLHEETLSAERRAKVLSIKSAGQSLISILNDILDLSKIQAGKFQLKRVDFDLRQMIAESLDIFSPRVAETGIALDADFAPDLPTLVNGDPTRIRQVLVNLIGNAVKFTERGSITLRVGVSERADERLVIRFEITDTGIGIAADDQQRLFEDFSQVDASTTRKYEGTGLGLAISKRLTELMDGEIGVDSIEGEGATFWFTVEAGRVEASGAQKTGKADEATYRATRSIRILVAEDNELNQMIICAVLNKFNHHVAVVSSGQAAVEAIRTDDFDLVLMDFHMPGMDGPEAARIIRGEPTGKADTPIIAITADVLVEHRALCLDAGMNGYITKPIVLSELVSAINDALGEEIHILT